MNLRRLLALAAALALLLPAVATAAPPPSLLAGPCVVGGSYDPACDVDHNGVIDVLDIQLAAGHWNQSGAFTSGSWDLDRQRRHDAREPTSWAPPTTRPSRSRSTVPVHCASSLARTVRTLSAAAR